MSIVIPFALILLAYGLGSIPFGLLLTRYAGAGDIRQQGSGNIGATNVLRIAGKKLAVVTLVLDALKGLAAVLIAKHVGSLGVAMWAALAVVLVHIFPVWLKFQGGKGVATTLAVLWGLYWPLGLFACAIWVAVFKFTRFSSLSALTALFFTPFAAFIFIENGFVTLLCIILAALVFYRHQDNILRLLRGEEQPSEISLKL